MSESRFNFISEIEYLLKISSQSEYTASEMKTEADIPIIALEIINKNSLRLYNTQLLPELPLPKVILEIISSYLPMLQFNCEFNRKFIQNPAVLDLPNFESMAYDISPENEENLKKNRFLSLVFCINNLTNGTVVLDPKYQFDRLEYKNHQLSLKPSPGDSKRSVIEEDQDDLSEQEKINQKIQKTVLHLFEMLNERLILEVDYKIEKPEQFNIYDDLKSCLNTAREKKQPAFKLLSNARHIRKRTSGITPLSELQQFSTIPLAFLFSALYQRSPTKLPVLNGALALMSLLPIVQNTLAILSLNNNLIKNESCWRKRLLLAAGLLTATTPIFDYHTQKRYQAIVEEFNSNPQANWMPKMLLTSISMFFEWKFTVTKNNAAFRVLLAEKLDNRKFPEKNIHFSLPCTLITLSLFATDLLYAWKTRSMAASDSDNPIIIHGGFYSQLLNSAIQIPRYLLLGSAVTKSVKHIIRNPRSLIEVHNVRDTNDFKQEKKFTLVEKFCNTLSFCFAAFVLLSNLTTFSENPIAGIFTLLALFKVMTLPAETRALQLCLNHSVLHQRPEERVVVRVEKKEAMEEKRRDKRQ